MLIIFSVLFGSPNPLVYPGAPFNYLTGANMGLEQKLEFQVRNSFYCSTYAF